MKTEKAYFEEAITLETYMNQMEKHQDNTMRIYEQFEVPQDDGFIELLREKKLDVLVITEDWCGDAMLNNPILARIAEAAQFNVRAVYRDEHPELINRYLTNGGRSIPIYLFLDDTGNVLLKWGPRADKLQTYVLDMKATLPSKEAPDFAEKQQVLIQGLTEEYVTKQEHWLTVYEDLRAKLLPVLQQ